MHRFLKHIKLMGSVFELIVICDDEESAQNFFETAIREITRIENLLSEYIEDSDTSKFNRAKAGVKVEVSEETYQLIKRSIQISSFTESCFDITMRPIKKLYSFKNQNFNLPPAALVEETLQKTGYRYLNLEEDNRISKAREGLEISFAAIGKGYAADKVRQLWLSSGLTSGVISASGDLSVLGKNEKGDSWSIGIPDPESPERILFHIPVSSGAVATSGDYEQHFTYNNKRYSHNIDPKSGYPCESIRSISVFSPSAELSDALATALYVMGPEKAIAFAKDLPDTHVIIIDQNKKVHFSDKINFIHD